MHFDETKVVRSPGCDHGHDEESRNGRDVKNDILEAYVWTSDVFQVKSGFYRNTGRVTGTPREHNGPTWALVERREGCPHGLRASPPSLVLLGLGEVAGPPSLSPPWRILVQLGLGGGNPTPRGSRTLLARQAWPASPSPLAPLYTGAGGTPKTHKLIYGSFLSRVRCPLPPNSTSIISLQCLGEALRR